MQYLLSHLSQEAFNFKFRLNHDINTERSRRFSREFRLLSAKSNNVNGKTFMNEQRRIFHQRLSHDIPDNTIIVIIVIASIVLEAETILEWELHRKGICLFPASAAAVWHDINEEKGEGM